MVETVGGAMALHSGVRTGQPNEPARISTMWSDEDYRGLEEDRGYSWLDDYLARLDGKEARQGYYARL